MFEIIKINSKSLIKMIKYGKKQEREMKKVIDEKEREKKYEWKRERWKNKTYPFHDCKSN